jgi:hypothetical protein
MPINSDYLASQGRVTNPNAYLVNKPSAPLSHWVLEFWQLNVPFGFYNYRSVPDNCVDMIINLYDPEEVFIVTPFSSCKVFEMTGPVSYFGIRFKPLGYQGLIFPPIGSWNNTDNIITANEVLDDSVLNWIQNCAGKVMSFEYRCEFFSTFLQGLLHHRQTDHRLSNFINYCNNEITSTTNLSNKQCEEFGVSARHLRRLTSLYLGQSPKAFAKVLRFQKTLQLMQNKHLPHLWSQHYYDQPHFIRDFKIMSGVTPHEFNKTSFLYNTK